MTTKNSPGHHPAIEMRAVSALRPYPNNARRHSKRQVRQIAESIRRFGFTNPVLVSDEGEIIAGHGRVEAAKVLGMDAVPTLALSHLGAAERRAYVLADNKLALNAGWDAEVLAIELQGLIDLDVDVSVTGFSLAEVDLVLDAGAAAFTEFKNLCVWNKTNGGMGSFYRSKHELVFVFKVGTTEHTNTFGLGDTGRYRTNVWDYAGISSIGSTRAEQLAMHPTVKPVALVADAIRDCTRRGEIVLDGFGGSGATLIAAETCGRKARLIEYDPVYCDTIITRWETLTGKQATLLGELAPVGGPVSGSLAANGLAMNGLAHSGETGAIPSSTVALAGLTFEEVAELRLGASWAASGSRRGAVEPGLRKDVRACAGNRRAGA